MRYPIHTLRQFLVATALLIGLVSNCSPILFAQFVADDLSFPYQALVLKDGAAVHSGPDSVHYETDKLKQGSTVEVHRHDPQGWCAIRPVDGSFSLIPEATVEFVDEGVGRIVENGTQAWVGTELGPVNKPLWQIKLQKGELVKVLGQINWPSPEGHSTIWYQIAPPAGEFRWIQMSDIQLPFSPRMEVNESKVVKPQAVAQSAVAGNVRSHYEIPEKIQRRETPDARFADAVEPAFAMNVPDLVQQASYQADLQPQTESMNRGWRQASRPIENDSPARRSFASGNSEYGQGNRNSLSTDSGMLQRRPQSYQQPITGYAPTRVASLDLTPPDFARNLNRDPNRLESRFNSGIRIGANLGKTTDELNDLLTQEMAEKNPAEWDLESIESATDAILESTMDRTEGAKAKRLSDKLANCEKIRSGYRSTTNVNSISPAARANALPIDMNLATQYDAYGWLNQMVRNGGQSEPTYVLQDDNGKIIYHVAPGPGINIHRHLKSKVGIVGQRGFHTRYQLDHVTVQQIVELKKPSR